MSPLSTRSSNFTPLSGMKPPICTSLLRKWQCGHSNAISTTCVHNSARGTRERVSKREGVARCVARRGACRAPRGRRESWSSETWWCPARVHTQASASAGVAAARPQTHKHTSRQPRLPHIVHAVGAQALQPQRLRVGAQRQVLRGRVRRRGVGVCRARRLLALLRRRHRGAHGARACVRQPVRACSASGACGVTFDGSAGREEGVGRLAHRRPESPTTQRAPLLLPPPPSANKPPAPQRARGA
jgi:hypothetical protein